ncbi:MAG: disulfide bond formation protein B [Rhodospirillales bacterium]|nr:disulfide bond formation protein B [Rhodospirillales bacterium]
MNFRLEGLTTALVAAFALGVAYFAQFGLHLVPCELCLLERWPYRITLALGIFALLLGGKAARVLVFMAGIAMLGGVVVSGLHVGVEFTWWPSPLPECNGILTPGAALPLTPAVPCDRPVYLIPGLPLSMAQMDFLGSFIFTAMLFRMATRRRNRSWA